MNKSILISHFDKIFEWIDGYLKKLDPHSTNFALKTCLALVVGYGLAFLLNFSASTTAITVLVLNTRYLGSSVDKGVLRITGTLSGAVIALFLIGFLAQERFLFIFVVAVLNAFLFYMMQGSRYPYSWFVCAMTILIVGFGSVENPDNIFHSAVSRVSGVILGIISSLLVHGLLRPSRAGDDFEKQLRNILHEASELLELKYSDYILDRSDANQIVKIERNIISGLPKLKSTLNAAAYDTGRFSRFLKSYNVLIAQTDTLVNLIFVLSETFKNCYTYPSLKFNIQKSQAFSEIMELITSYTRKLVSDCDLSRDGTIVNDDSAFQAEFQTKLDSLTEEFKSQGLDPESTLAFFIMRTKLEELASLIIKFRSILLSVESPGKSEFFNASQPEIFEIEESFSITSPRFMKAITSALMIMLASIIWITTDWPLGYSSFLLFVWIISYVNIVSPAVPTKPILSGFIWAAAVGSVMYFLLMPQLDNYQQLAPLIILMFFPFCYKMNNPSPLISVWGMIASVLLVMFANISEVQTYSFSTYVNTFIGTGGGLLIGLVILSIFSYRRPEKEFKKQMILFFGSCEEMLKQLDKHKPWTPKGRSILFSGRKELINHIKNTILWAGTLNYERTPDNDKTKVKSLLSSLEDITFRLDSLEEARQEFKDESKILSIKDKGHEIRQTIKDEFGLIKNSISNGEQVPDFPDISELVKQISEDLKEIRNREGADKNLSELAVRILLVAGFYQSLAASLDECREKVNKINWNTFDQAYF
ncbi:MAG: FUSC family protein [Thermodesulfobacteriota bacterium]